MCYLIFCNKLCRYFTLKTMISQIYPPGPNMRDDEGTEETGAQHKTN